ncbi:MAG TPA: zinc-dependent alcohol dehydrogenase family protein [Burkholderiaceae bacterium]|nr:zinc-dependent alcohol dehydrogenase family protein [Burkholderiaceae bacterium]
MLETDAMVLEAARTALVARRIAIPAPGRGQLRLAVSACGVCRTDLHVIDGDLPQPKLPLVLGHEIVGRVEALGEGVERFAVGDRIGVPWLGHACGGCPYCRRAQENLCDEPLFTGYTRDGGYARHALADAAFCFALPRSMDDIHVAPLLCAGLIGYRALRMAQDAQTLGLYGFGAAAHLVAQVALAQGRSVYAFTRTGDDASQHFARGIGCAWAGDSSSPPPSPLDAALIFAPVGALVPTALRATRKGGIVVCAGIHMSDIPSFPYAALWGERVVRSVANLTRADGDEFFALLERSPVRTSVSAFPLQEANRALAALRGGDLNGAAVLDCRA